MRTSRPQTKQINQQTKDQQPPSQNEQAQKASASASPKKPHKNNQPKESVKVDADRLDKLIDLIGEMVIAQSMVSDDSEIKALNSNRISERLGQMDKLTRELQEIGTSLRMVPLKATFQKTARMVRDLSKKLNKPLDFITDGEDTELDKSLVAAIGDPLVHMIRNAVDHGLEPSEEDRIKMGKPAKGQIYLNAYHQSGSIHIEIRDDGRGLNREKLVQ